MSPCVKRTVVLKISVFFERLQNISLFSTTVVFFSFLRSALTSSRFSFKTFHTSIHLASLSFLNCLRNFSTVCSNHRSVFGPQELLLPRASSVLPSPLCLLRERIRNTVAQRPSFNALKSSFAFLSTTWNKSRWNLLISCWEMIYDEARAR